MNRLKWIDRWRGILISQIVLFHVLGVFYNNAEGVNKDVIDFICKFLAKYHVYAFVFLSGVIWRENRSAIEFVKKRAKRLLVPYFVFGFIWALLFSFLGERFIASHPEYKMVLPTNPVLSSLQWLGSVILANGWPNGIGFRVINVLWFLPPMFLSGCIYFFIDRYCMKRSIHFIVGIFLFFLWLQVRWLNLPWSLGEVPKFVIFMMLGRMFYVFNIFRLEKFRIPFRLLAVFLGGVILLLSDNLPSNCNDIMLFCCGVAGALMTAFLAQTVNFEWLEFVGVASLGVLVLHKFVIVLMQIIPGLIDVVLKSDYNASVTLLFAFIASVVVICTSCVGTIGVRRYCRWMLGE